MPRKKPNLSPEDRARRSEAAKDLWKRRGERTPQWWREFAAKGRQKSLDNRREEREELARLREVVGSGSGYPDLSADDDVTMS